MCLAIPGEILSIQDGEPLMRTGRVRFGGIVKEVSLAYVPEAEIGDYVIVHVGFAIVSSTKRKPTRCLSTKIGSWRSQARPMKFIDQCRDPAQSGNMRAIAQLVTLQTIMEIWRADHAMTGSALTNSYRRTSPCCTARLPVCVTPIDLIDEAIELASRPGVIFTSFGDMLRVPGSERDLLSVKASGGDVRIVYSPLDALQIARANPEKQIVFFAVGFETTAPANAMAYAADQQVSRISILVSHVLVHPLSKRSVVA
jgi:hydrogenase assembly chaperone HypC/HupF